MMEFSGDASRLVGFLSIKHSYYRVSVSFSNQYHDRLEELISGRSLLTASKLNQF